MQYIFWKFQSMMYHRFPDPACDERTVVLLAKKEPLCCLPSSSYTLWVSRYFQFASDLVLEVWSYQVTTAQARRQNWRDTSTHILSQAESGNKHTFSNAIGQQNSPMELMENIKDEELWRSMTANAYGHGTWWCCLFKAVSWILLFFCLLMGLESLHVK